MNESIIRWVVESCLRHTKTISICYESERYTYSELLLATSVVARKLLKAGVKKGDRVLVSCNKLPEVIPTYLAVLLTGATYVPLDLRLPHERLSTIARDSGAAAAIIHTRARGAIELKEFTNAPTIEIKNFISMTFGCDTFQENELKSLLREIESEDLAYILYTSGSTGIPKGVAITHNNARAFVSWASTYFNVQANDKIALVSPFSFDLCVFDIYCGLSAGASLYVFSEKVIMLPQATFNHLESQKITVLYGVPTFLIALLNKSELTSHTLSNVRLLMYAGEPFPIHNLRRLMECLPNASVYNLYGPIETNVITVMALTRNELVTLDRAPIGNAVSGTNLRLMDENYNLINESGVCGELVVSGESVFSGYWQRPELNRHVFLKIGGKQFYRTSDIVSINHKGQLVLHGRQDNVVKIRGFRIELEEVELALQSLPEIAVAAVVALDNLAGTKALHAYIKPTPGSVVEPARVRTALTAKLPVHCIPEHFHFVDMFPVTTTGKISRRELIKGSYISYAMKGE